MKLAGGLGLAEEGRSYALHGESAAAGALCRGGGSLAVQRWGGRIWEVRWEAVVVLGYLIWGRREWWRGAPWWPWAAAAMAHGGARARRGEPDSARRLEGSGEGG